MLCSFDKFFETGRDSRNCSKKFFFFKFGRYALRFIKRDFRVDFSKLAPSRDFETSSRAVIKLNGATLILRERYCKAHIAFL